MGKDWKEFVEYARGRGVLAKELFVVHSKPVVSADEIAETLPAHLDYQKKLEAEGVLFAAGPMADENGAVWSMEGLIILNAVSLEAARVLADNDPMHKEGKKEYTIRPWLMNEGRLQIDVCLSNQKAGIG
ncbi:MAG: YciI family protein [Hyphomicrobiales bacterium]